MAMQRALVLGGGGPVGLAWESGLVAALRDAGVQASDFGAIVGTSAGAIVGAQFAHGHLPEREPEPSGRSERRSQRPKLEMEVLGPIFRRWATMELTTREDVQAIGAVVRGLDRSGLPAWLGYIAGAVPTHHWPEGRLLITAVDTESGERRAFERASGVELVHAIAASAAVPGFYPAVEIEGRLYMDGQVHSSTHADLLADEAPAEVVIVMPTNRATSPGIGGHAERMLEHELARLRAVGSAVRVVTPEGETAARMGTNLMDVDYMPEARALGLQVGRELAQQLR